MSSKSRIRSPLPRNVVFAELPGPTRHRSASPYCYRLLHESSEPQEEGCLLLWEVFGGREIYHVALEREDSGDLHWHCSCADAVYRGDRRVTHCKHVRGLRGHGRCAG